MENHRNQCDWIILVGFWSYFLNCCLFFNLLVSQSCILSSSTHNHAQTKREKHRKWTGPQGSLGNPRETYIFTYFPELFGIFCQILWLWVKKTWFLSFSGKKWCRIIYKFRQNTISGPETCQIGPKLWLRSCPDLLFTP